MQASILAITSHLPGVPVSNAELAKTYPDWDLTRIAAKTGILQRYVAAENETASDLAFVAAQKLFERGICGPEEIDYVLLCTQSPDYFLPTTACLLQQRLHIPKTAGALDFNLGCSGYVYGLGIAQGLISTGQASKILFLTAETYSKYVDPSDRGSATIFGDGATATLIGGVPDEGQTYQAAYVYGSDGSGAEQLIVRGGGMRERCSRGGAGEAKNSPADFLYMNGPEVFQFAMRVVPANVHALLQKTGKQVADIDLFVFHQANQYMLENLRKNLKIPEERFYTSFVSCGNTVSGTIPLALESALAEGRLGAGQSVLLAGFGVGLSWGSTLLSWPFLGIKTGI